MAYNFSIFELLRVSGVLWLCVGLLFLFSPHAPLQALLFVGETIPRPSLSPFASAPFEHYVTPPGLKEQWPVYQMYARLIGVIAVVWSVVHVVLAMRLMQQQQSWDAFLVRRGKRGVKVGQAVEEYEDKEKNIQEEILPLGKGWTGMLHAVTHMQTIVSGKKSRYLARSMNSYIAAVHE